MFKREEENHSMSRRVYVAARRIASLSYIYQLSTPHIFLFPQNVNHKLMNERELNRNIGTNYYGSTMEDRSAYSDDMRPRSSGWGARTEPSERLNENINFMDVEWYRNGELFSGTSLMIQLLPLCWWWVEGEFRGSRANQTTQFNLFFLGKIWILK